MDGKRVPDLPLLFRQVDGPAVAHERKTYQLQIYPGIGGIDTLLIDLQQGKVYPQLSKDLLITDTIAILEGYPD